MKKSTVFLLLALLPSLLLANVVTDRVTRVIDGDTVVLDSIGKARLIGVDTPETVHPQKAVEEYGKEASDFTRRILEGKTVRVDFDWQKTDKYQRTLVYLYLGDSTFFNAELIKQGFAHAYTKYPFKYLDQFRDYEREARENNRGLWGIPAKDVSFVLAQNEKEEQTVYITRTGECYHRGWCSSLRKSKIPVTKKEAIERGYRPCKRCKP